LTGDLGYSEFLIVTLAVLGSAIIKNGVGIGAGIFLLPFLSLVFPPKLALGLGAPAMLVSDLVGVRNYWREWNGKELFLLLPPAFLGIIIGALIVKIIPGEIFRLVVGVIAVTFSCYHLAKRAISGRNKTTTPIPAMNDTSKYQTSLFGFFGGIASTVTHAGGMVLSIYLLQKPIDKRQFVGTFVLFFSIVNFLKLFTYTRIGIISIESILLVTLVSPVIIVGGFLGDLLNRKFSQEWFRMIVLAIILIIGIRLLSNIEFLIG
jgi:uncharacterized membrane protein YfcA